MNVLDFRAMFKNACFQQGVKIVKFKEISV